MKGKSEALPSRVDTQFNEFPAGVVALCEHMTHLGPLERSRPGNDSSADFNPPVAQRFTTGSNPGGYTLSRVEIKPEDSDSFSVSVCGVDEDGFPNLTCTALTAPGSFAPGTLVFNAPAGTTVSASTTYTVVATPGSNDVTFDATTADCEDTGGAAGWALANAYDWRDSSNAWVTTTTNKSLRVAIKGPTVQVPAAVSDVVVVPVSRTANSLQVSWSAPDDAGRNNVMEDSKKLDSRRSR